MHDHSHQHDHPHPGSGARALRWALLLNGSFLIVEATAGALTGSLALLSDAVHMLSDVGALMLALLAAKLAEWGVSQARTFGFKRAEVLGGFLNALTQLGACVYIVYEAIGRLQGGPPEVPGWPILAVGVIGLGINLGSAWALYRAGGDNLNIRGALVHMLADALGSVGAIVAAGLVLVGFPAADALVSLLIAGLVLWGTWGLLRDSTRVLLQLPPPGFDVQGLTDLLLADSEVRSVHDVHVWTLDGHKPIVSAHASLTSPVSGESVRNRLSLALQEQLQVHHLTLQLESPGVQCASVDCGLSGGRHA